MNWNRVLRIGGGVATLGVAALALLYIRRGYIACQPPVTPVTDEQRNHVKSALPSLIEMSFLGADGLELRGWYVPPTNGVVLVYAHGLGSNRSEFIPEVKLLAQHGYGGLLFDARAHGSSEGRTATWGDREALDLIAAADFARAQQGVSGVCLVGFSVGASAVSHSIARGITTDAAILYATWTSLSEEILSKAGRGGSLAAFFMSLGYRYAGVDIGSIRPINQLSSFSPHPLLFIAGGKDADTPPAIMTRVFASASLPKEIWHIPSAGHGAYLKTAPVEYERRVLAFLDRTFEKNNVSR